MIQQETKIVLQTLLKKQTTKNLRNKVTFNKNCSRSTSIKNNTYLLKKHFISSFLFDYNYMQYSIPFKTNLASSVQVRMKEKFSKYSKPWNENKILNKQKLNDAVLYKNFDLLKIAAESDATFVNILPILDFAVPTINTIRSIPTVTIDLQKKSSSLSKVKQYFISYQFINLFIVNKLNSFTKYLTIFEV